MIKKILFTLLLSISFISFSQEKHIKGLSAAPNPFTNSTTISFSAASTSNVFFSVKNVLGKTVYRKSIPVKLGRNTINFYKNNLPTGIYIYSIQDKKKIISKRFVIK